MPIVVNPTPLSDQMDHPEMTHDMICSVGGELRLCLPQILRQTLAQFHWQQICRACEELQIHCAPCSSSQLGALKAAGVLPVAAHQCGLITKSDAERLTSYLMIQNSQVRHTSTLHL